MRKGAQLSSFDASPHHFRGVLLILIDFVFLAIPWVLNAVLVIIAAIKASDGEFYRYPITIRFIQ